MTRELRQPGPSFWFHPNILPFHWPPGNANPRYLGSSETTAAFADTGEWKALARCDVMQLFVDGCRDTSTGEPNAPNGAGTNGYLRRVVAMSKRFGLELAIESAGAYGLASTASANAGGGMVDLSTGAKSAHYDLDTSIANIYALGGTVGWIGMDHPIQRVKDGLGLTNAQACAQVLEYMQTIHAAYPAIKIGLIDQHGNWIAAAPSLTPWATLLSTLAAGNESLRFLHIDMPYEFANAKEPGDSDTLNYFRDLLPAIQDAAQAAAIPFGLILNSAFGGGGLDADPITTYPGAPFAGSDALFRKYTLLYAEQIRRLVKSGRIDVLDHAIVESWSYYPRDLAPDTTPNTFCDTFLGVKAVLNSDIYKAL